MGAPVSAVNLLAFALAAALLIAIPGPSVLFIVSRAIALGRRGALLTVVGNTCGEYLQVVAVALGVGAIVRASATAFLVLRVAGAAYLIFLGLRTFLGRRHRLASGRHDNARGDLRIFQDGLAVGSTNPKTAIFFSAILPQFVLPSQGEVTFQILALGLVWVSLVLVGDGIWALTASGVRSRLLSNPRRAQTAVGVSGLVTAGLGVGLLVAGGRR
jgi:threonine/homoserine/homoserine lactone efflux protein